ncbi:hypothetical protein [Parvibaculum sp.]|uniref:hypothetical protein n=1 Tax=Parvibaculum sp. TaxID=2024848 RepID=UPI00320FA55A
MVESLMLLALGFLTATLFAIIAIQLVRRRAVAVTTARVTQELRNADQRAHEEAASAATRISALEAKIAELVSGNSAFADRNAELEQAAVAAATEAETRRREIDELRAGCKAAEQEAETLRRTIPQLEARIDMLRQRIKNLEAAGSAEIDRQAEVQQQLKALGEKAARLVHEMTETFEQVASATGLQAAVAAPAPEAAVVPQEPAAQAPAVAKLTPFPAKELGTGFEELSAIKASLSSTFENTAPTDFDDDEDSLPGEMILAERIKALEAGVTS